jgi:hypothetical protein
LLIDVIISAIETSVNKQGSIISVQENVGPKQVKGPLQIEFLAAW